MKTVTKKTRKKRTTIKEAFDNGFDSGRRAAKEEFVETIDNMMKDCKEKITQFPRNCKFVELEYDILDDLREKLIYSCRSKSNE